MLRLFALSIASRVSVFRLSRICRLAARFVTVLCKRVIVYALRKSAALSSVSLPLERSFSHDVFIV